MKNPNEIYEKGGKEDLPGLMHSRGAWTKSRQGQVGAAAVVKVEAKVDGRSGARGFGRHEEEDGDEEAGGKEKGPLTQFIRQMDK